MNHNAPTELNAFSQENGSSVTHKNVITVGRGNTHYGIFRWGKMGFGIVQYVSQYDEIGSNSKPPICGFAGSFFHTSLSPTPVHPQKIPVSSLLFISFIPFMRRARLRDIAGRDKKPGCATDSITSGSTPDRGIGGDSLVSLFPSAIGIVIDIAIPATTQTIQAPHGRGRFKAVKTPFLENLYPILYFPAPATLDYDYNYNYNYNINFVGLVD